jgi:cysteinyl-tRNA synthetase
MQDLSPSSFKTLSQRLYDDIEMVKTFKLHSGRDEPKMTGKEISAKANNMDYKCWIAAENYEKWRCFYGDGDPFWPILDSIINPLKWNRDSFTVWIRLFNGIFEGIQGEWH